MSVNEANHLLPVPSGPLQIPAVGTCGSTFAEDTQPIYFSLVIPTYNECKNVKSIVEQLSKLLDGSIPGNYELIVVDDNSPDRTWEVALSLTAEYPQLQVMRREDERGLSTAVIRGWQAARGEVLGVIDADLQHPPETLLQLLAEIQRGADLAAASRHVAEGGVSDWSVVRRFLSRGAQTVGLIILPGVVGRVSDPMSGYFMVRRSCIAGQTMNPAGYKILIEVLGRGNIRWIGEVGYVFQERKEGESKVTGKQYIEYLRHLFILRFARWPVGKFLRFGIVGFSGVFVNMGVLYVLRNSLHLELTRSLIIAAELAIISNFLWNDLWTFGDISKRQPGNRQRFKRLLKFNTICLMGLILNVLLVNLMFNVFGINEYLANLIAIVAVTLWNFWINMKLSWRVTEVD
ncbi:MAG: glycosyltransferase [Microcoleus sp. PH2017_29_MFU_D_A]|jgi:dolichol-phosphate mannosyltransferase|nr:MULTISPECIES: glycosyltransferase [unclassified Microcoleus]MCC3419488.1 glycosyltransferase [Microcoleus sp. PH2017_07_MST_O_A]MCC3466782.1 glycosyltransferase [Microcoleus sp. PH2017_06_SFM_O_A]MCC3513128.1 glycosyltransferase [Microcoleus sp. PH2017_17_BER_D_A]TAE09576.1 MAG: glycosyltransferase [Oscillatoriales cyanobacterium]MCC3411491.1 glycosyltransferase [Microcoleus sp. PH2017_02_FOX_O_A]